jgi:hypothetical protein
MCPKRVAPPYPAPAQGASSVQDQTVIKAALRNGFRRAEINPAILRTTSRARPSYAARHTYIA